MSAVDTAAVDQELESMEPFGWKTQSIAAGMALCVGIGLLFSNILLGVALGLLTGVLVGYALDFGLTAEPVDEVAITEEETLVFSGPRDVAHRLSA